MMLRTGEPPMMTYLCSPYSHVKYEKRYDRFVSACRAAAILMKRGLHVFSPIAHSHSVSEGAEDIELPTDWSYWQHQDQWYLDRIDAVAVLMLDGWEKSVGVQAEIEIAKKRGLPISYWRFQGLELVEVPEP